MIRTLILLIVSVLTVSGQVKIETFKPRQIDIDGSDGYRENFSIKLPFFISENNKVASKMNEYLYQNTAAEIKSVPKSYRDKSLTIDVTSFQYLDYTYSVFRNNSQIVSVYLKSLSNSGTPAHFTEEFYNFETSTGRYLTINNLLTTVGERKLSQRFISYWTRMKDSLERKWDIEVESYEKDRKNYICEGFLITDSRIIFYHGFWVNARRQKAFTIAYSISAMKPFLNEYGRKILLGEWKTTAQRK